MLSKQEKRIVKGVRKISAKENMQTQTERIILK